jgi:hypothetical protein
VRRLASAAVITTLALATLSGCFLLPEAPDATPEPTETEQVQAGDGFAAIGDCWNTNYSDMAEWSSWQGDGPVNCDEQHHSYTYFVGELEAEVDEAWHDGAITAELASAVSDECAPHRDALGVPDDAGRVGGYFFVAPESDWENGDHRIRCDLAVSAIDSDWREPELEELPADVDDLVSDIDRHPRSYELCLIGDGYGPYDSTEAYLADCGADYYWRYAGTVEFPSPAGVPYPAEDQLYGLADSECSTLGLRSGETALSYPPSAEGWDAGYRDVTCWTTTLSEPSTPV